MPTGIAKSYTKVTDLLKNKKTILDEKLYNAEQELDKLSKEQPSDEITEIKEQISKARKELKEEKKEGAELDPASVDKMYNLRKNITELSQKKAEIIKTANNNKVKEIDRLISNNTAELKRLHDQGAEYDPASVDKKNTLQKQKIELLTNKTEELKKQKSEKNTKTERLIRGLTHIQNGISVVDSAYDVYSRMKNHDAKIDNLDKKIQDADKKIKQLESYERNIYNQMIPLINSMRANVKEASTNAQDKSHTDLDIIKWKIQRSIKDVQVQIKELTQGFNVQPYLARCIEKFEYGMSTMIQIYDRIQDEYDKKQVADLITNVASSAKITNNAILSGAIDELELIMKSSLVVQEYKQAMSAFKQYMFPFAYLYLGEFKLNKSELISNAVTRVGELKDEVQKNRILIKKDTDSNAHSKTEFNSAKQGPGPFFIWKHEIYQEEISKLLQGKEIVINANIAQGIKHNAIKFNEIGIYFKLLNATLQRDLDDKLYNFQVNMTHLGNSYYKCGSQFYVIYHEPLQIKHYVTLKDDKYSDPNDVSSKIQENFPILSPYTMWRIQLFSDKDNNTIFDQFTKYTNESIDLELVGKGRYLEKESTCSNNLEEHYKVADDILQLDSNHKHRHHHGENHHRKRREVDDLNNIRHDSDDLMIKNDVGSIVKQISYDIVDHISTEDTSSSASSIRSPINTAINWLSSSLGKLKFFSPTNLVNYEYVKDGIQSIFAKSEHVDSENIKDNTVTSINIGQFDTNASLTLADFLIRCVTKVKPYNTKEESIDLSYVRAYVSNVIVRYQEMLNDLSIQNNLPAEDLEFNPLDLMSRLEKEIINGDPRKLGKILYQHTINNNTNYDSNEIEEKINKILEHKSEQFTYNQELNTDNTNNNSTILEDMTNTIIGIADDINHTNYQSEVNMIG